MLRVIGDLEDSSFIPPDIYTFGFSGPFAYSRKGPASFFEPGRLLAYMNTAVNEWIFVKFYIGDLYENMFKSKFEQNQTKIWDT